MNPRSQTPDAATRKHHVSVVTRDQLEQAWQLAEGRGYIGIPVADDAVVMLSKNVKDTPANGLCLSLVARQPQDENAIITPAAKFVYDIDRFVSAAVVDETEIDARLAVRRAGELLDGKAKAFVKTWNYDCAAVHIA